MEKFYDLIMLLLVLLILILLFRVAMGIHWQAMNFSGELPADLRV